jgi:hypothetical protein
LLCFLRLKQRGRTHDNQRLHVASELLHSTVADGVPDRKFPRCGVDFSVKFSVAEKNDRQSHNHRPAVDFYIRLSRQPQRRMQYNLQWRITHTTATMVAHSRCSSIAALKRNF